MASLETGPPSSGDGQVEPPWKRARVSHDQSSAENGAYNSAPRNMLGRSAYYKTRICGGYADGSCTYGDRCNYAHGEHELQKMPAHDSSGRHVPPDSRGGTQDALLLAIRKQKPCRKFFYEGGCTYGDRCNFSHDESVRVANEQERKDPTIRPANFKTRLCLKWQQGGICQYADKCHFAHGEHDLLPFGGGAPVRGRQQEPQQSAGNSSATPYPTGGGYSAAGPAPRPASASALNSQAGAADGGVTERGGPKSAAMNGSMQEASGLDGEGREEGFEAFTDRIYADPIWDEEEDGEGATEKAGQGSEEPGDIGEGAYQRSGSRQNGSPVFNLKSSVGGGGVSGSAWSRGNVVQGGSWHDGGDGGLVV